MADRLPRYWKKPASGMVLQKFILVNLRCLNKDNLKKTVFMMLQCIYEPKNTKNNLNILLRQIANTVFFVDSYFKLSSFLPCALNYDN